MADNDIQLICFDLGGVMVRICRSWQEAASRAGLPWRDGIEDVLQRGLSERKRLVYEFQTGRMDIAPYFEGMSVSLERLYAPEEISAVHDAWIHDEYDGLAAVIDAIHDAGVITACLSNINPIHWERLIRMPAVSKLHHQFASHLIGHHKPDEDIYRHLERELNVNGASILFFDDLEENVHAAHKLGWRAVQIDHASPTDAQIRSALGRHGIDIARIETR